MKQLVLLLVGTLFAVNTFAGTGAILNGDAITKAIQGKHSYAAPKSGEFNIVYGGQDISRGSINLQTGTVDQAVNIV